MRDIKRRISSRNPKIEEVPKAWRMYRLVLYSRLNILHGWRTQVLLLPYEQATEGFKMLDDVKAVPLENVAPYCDGKKVIFVSAVLQDVYDD